MQLLGPYGPVYIRPDDIVALDGLYDHPFYDARRPSGQAGPGVAPCRTLHLRGGVHVVVLDDPKNVTLILDCLATAQPL